MSPHTGAWEVRLAGIGPHRRLTQGPVLLPQVAPFEEFSHPILVSGGGASLQDPGNAAFSMMLSLSPLPGKVRMSRKSGLF